MLIKQKSWLKVVLVLFSLSFFLSGCKEPSSNADSSKAKIKIVVATSAVPKPFVYVDKNSQLQGYDIDVVKALFHHLPQYELAFEVTEFPSVLAGLDSDRYQIGANNFTMNDKRKEKYIYSDAIFKNQYVIAISQTNSNIHSFDDLAGKRTEVSPGLNYATALENYNLTHKDNPVLMTYTEADFLVILQNVESGKYDFQLIDRAMLQQFIDEHKLALKFINLNDQDSQKIATPYSYLLISKGRKGQQLASDINGAIQQIMDDGTLSQISYHYFGADFSPVAK